MVLNLPVPRLSPRSSYQRHSSSQSLSSSSTLSQALRTNPFGTRPSLTDAATDREAELEELNDALCTLTRLFPDVKADVLRELLLRFPGESRLQISVEQLLKYRAEWVKGRWNVPPVEVADTLPAEELFRSGNYQNATKATLYLEFRSLSRSTVDAVLAENNFSYSRARPVLRELAKRTWRATIGNFNIFRKKKEKDDFPNQLFEKSASDSIGLQLKETGCRELDEELQSLILRPVTLQQMKEQEENDHNLAFAINQVEAEKAEALYECDCCCGETTFELISTCTDGFHVLCFDCIRRTMHEALFGQGWGKSVDAGRGTLRCLAPLVDETCDGCIPRSKVNQALLADKSGRETWAKFEDRLAAECLLKSRMKLIRCPFCSYAEADPIYQIGSSSHIRWHLKPVNSLITIVNLIILIDFFPLLLFLVLLFSLFSPRQPLHFFKTSLETLSRRKRSPRFTCRNPSCLRKSCLKCSKAWHDPHACHEPLLLSLRTTVETARTAAIKRTCPRCGLSFVKASGCNKLTCVCGYAMCYLCRKALGPPANGGARRGLVDGEEEEEEGYRHFCEHFRINPGRPCTECRKCDLYRAEDEDIVVRRAGEEAERLWRIKEGMVGVEGLGTMPGDLEREKSSIWELFVDGRWTWQEVVDWGVTRVVDVET